MSLGTILTVWKAFHYSPKRAEKLAEIEAVLNTPEIKLPNPVILSCWPENAESKLSGKFVLL